MRRFYVEGSLASTTASIMSTKFLAASSREAHGLLFSIFTVGLVRRLISVRAWEEGRVGCLFLRQPFLQFHAVARIGLAELW